MKLMLALVCLTVLALVEGSPVNFLTDDFISIVNQRAKTWKARRNFPEGTPLSDLRKRLGALPSPAGNEFDDDVTVDYDISIDSLPKEFDPREKWSNCPSLREIRDQGVCGSCWAVSSVEVMTDRHCIHSKGKSNFHYSSQHLVSCCPSCGYGCDGGYPGMAFRYWQREGIVSGGPYESSEGCYPYEIPPTGWPVKTPPCKGECQTNYTETFDGDRHFAEKMYRVSEKEESIMYELVNNGPVVAAFDVFEDFYVYESGVYQHTYGSLRGGHAIKILGYGVENGTPYWLCANSWNEDWGDKGYFKILRGSNECGIEGRIRTGLPKYD